MIFLGTINGSVGLKGLVKIRSFCEPTDSIKKYNPIYIEGSRLPIKIKFVGSHKKNFTASIGTIEDKKSADRLKGKRLFIERHSLPKLKKDEFYHSDLLDCKIFNEGKKMIGRVVSVENYGAGDIIEFWIEKKKKNLMIPLNKKFIKEIRIDEKKIHIHSDLIDD